MERHASVRSATLEVATGLLDRDGGGQVIEPRRGEEERKEHSGLAAIGTAAVGEDKSSVKIKLRNLKRRNNSAGEVGNDDE